MILLVGAGPMAIDHSRVLDAQNENYTVVGRGKKSAQNFENETKHPVICGGISQYISSQDTLPEKAIVSVGVEQLAETTAQLIENGVKSILVEKPAGLTIAEISYLETLSTKYDADVFVAYNRRFFSSVLEAEKIINDDGGVENFTFEVTEWGHTIKPLQKAKGVKENWFLGNTTHIVDLAFYLGGMPRNINCYTNGKTDWHQRSAIFAGAGDTQSGALFSYIGNWNAPGRWSLDVITRNYRLIFRPIEKLQIQKIGSIAIENVEISDELDLTYKPGLFLQLKHFLSNDKLNLCTINEHVEKCNIYNKISGYET